VAEEPSRFRFLGPIAGDFGPIPDDFDPFPDNFGPNPDDFNPNPDDFGPNPDDFDLIAEIIRNKVVPDEDALPSGVVPGADASPFGVVQDAASPFGVEPDEDASSSEEDPLDSLARMPVHVSATPFPVHSTINAFFVNVGFFDASTRNLVLRGNTTYIADSLIVHLKTMFGNLPPETSPLRNDVMEWMAGREVHDNIKPLPTRDGWQPVSVEVMTSNGHMVADLTWWTPIQRLNMLKDVAQGVLCDVVQQLRRLVTHDHLDSGFDADDTFQYATLQHLHGRINGFLAPAEDARLRVVEYARVINRAARETLFRPNSGPVALVSENIWKLDGGEFALPCLETPPRGPAALRQFVLRHVLHADVDMTGTGTDRGRASTLENVIGRSWMITNLEVAPTMCLTAGALAVAIAAKFNVSALLDAAKEQLVETHDVINEDGAGSSTATSLPPARAILSSTITAVLHAALRLLKGRVPNAAAAVTPPISMRLSLPAASLGVLMGISRYVPQNANKMQTPESGAEIVLYSHSDSIRELLGVVVDSNRFGESSNVDNRRWGTPSAEKWPLTTRPVNDVQVLSKIEAAVLTSTVLGLMDLDSASNCMPLKHWPEHSAVLVTLPFGMPLVLETAEEISQMFRSMPVMVDPVVTYQIMMGQKNASTSLKDMLGELVILTPVEKDREQLPFKVQAKLLFAKPPSAGGGELAAKVYTVSKSDGLPVMTDSAGHETPLVVIAQPAFFFAPYMTTSILADPEKIEFWNVAIVSTWNNFTARVLDMLPHSVAARLKWGMDGTLHDLARLPDRMEADVSDQARTHAEEGRFSVPTSVVANKMVLGRENAFDVMDPYGIAHVATAREINRLQFL
jgi:hypothetical protein